MYYISGKLNRIFHNTAQLTFYGKIDFDNVLVTSFINDTDVSFYSCQCGR